MSINFDQELRRKCRFPTLAIKERPIAMGLVAANLRPIKLGDFFAASSVSLLVPGSGSIPDAVSGRISKAIAAIPDTETGQAPDAWRIVSPTGEPLAFVPEMPANALRKPCTEINREEENAFRETGAPKARDTGDGSLGDRASLSRIRRHRARRRRGPACLRRQDSRKLHAEFRRHRVDAHVGRAGLDDDDPGPRTCSMAAWCARRTSATR